MLITKRMFLVKDKNVGLCLFITKMKKKFKLKLKKVKYWIPDSDIRLKIPVLDLRYTC